jgi:hypothetical protein
MPCDHLIGRLCIRARLETPTFRNNPAYAICKHKLKFEDLPVELLSLGINLAGAQGRKL